jgi:hypothetical protein
MQRSKNDRYSITLVDAGELRGQTLTGKRVQVNGVPPVAERWITTSAVIQQMTMSTMARGVFAGNEKSLRRRRGCAGSQSFKK